MINFWYESNTCWGWINSLDDLIEKHNLIMTDASVFKTTDMFLEKSTQNINGSLDFGTRMEHGTNSKSLKTYLKEEGLLDEFLNKIDCNLISSQYNK